MACRGHQVSTAKRVREGAEPAGPRASVHAAPFRDIERLNGTPEWQTRGLQMHWRGLGEGGIFRQNTRLNIHVLKTFKKLAATGF